jgi:type IV pilus biogenesis protein CpaD/CtpE
MRNTFFIAISPTFSHWARPTSEKSGRPRNLLIDGRIVTMTQHRMLVKALALVSSVLLLEACSSAPVSFSSTTPQPLETAYGCALRKVNELGYTVTNTNKDGGFINAEKQTSSGLGEFLTSKKYHDVLTVAIFDDGKGGRTMRVTAAGSEQSSGLFSSASKGDKAPSNGGKADANTILSACAQGAAQTSTLPNMYRTEAFVAD